MKSSKREHGGMSGSQLAGGGSGGGRSWVWLVVNLTVGAAGGEGWIWSRPTH